jgi:hypothetical protein
MKSDIRFSVVKEHKMVEDLLDQVLFYGELCGPVMSGEFVGSQMIRIVECPDFAKFRYDARFVGRLVPSALVSHGFDYPLYDEDRKLRKFKLILKAAPEHEQPLASAESFADVLEHAYAHSRAYPMGNGTYYIINTQTEREICHAFKQTGSNDALSWEQSE